MIATIGRTVESRLLDADSNAPPVRVSSKAALVVGRFGAAPLACRSSVGVATLMMKSSDGRLSAASG
jgi:hypothetical protein